MRIINYSDQSITLVDFLSPGEHLLVEPEQESIDFVPSKDKLNRLILFTDKIEIRVHSAEELDLVGQLDSRFINIVELYE